MHEKLLAAKLLVLWGQILLMWRDGTKPSPFSRKQKCRTDLHPCQLCIKVFSSSSLTNSRHYQPFHHWIEVYASWREVIYYPSFGLLCCLVPGEGNGNLLQYPCLKNPMDKGAWWATVHAVKESDGTSDWACMLLGTLRVFSVLFLFIFYNWMWKHLSWALSNSQFELVKGEDRGLLAPTEGS